MPKGLIYIIMKKNIVKSFCEYLRKNGSTFYLGKVAGEYYINIFNLNADFFEFKQELKKYNLDSHAGFNCIVIEF